MIPIQIDKNTSIHHDGKTFNLTSRSNTQVISRHKTIGDALHAYKVQKVIGAHDLNMADLHAMIRRLDEKLEKVGRKVLREMVQAKTKR